MKVLHILCELNPSGAETMLYSAASAMERHGLESHILATGEQVGVFAQALENVGYTIHHIPFKKSPSYFFDLYRLFKKCSFDSIHVHTEQGAFWVSIVILLAGLPPRRCIRTIHNTFQFKGMLRWRRALQRKILHSIGIPHIAISKSVQQVEKNFYYINTSIIQNWYNSLRFTKTSEMQYYAMRKEMHIQTSDFVICSVGNCSLVKNHASLIKAIAGIQKQNIIYLHIGIEADDCEQLLAEELKIKSCIRFLGMQTNILPFLQAADLYIMPSTYEGFGIAAIEAIATELPVLLTNVPGLVDFVDTFSGLYYCEPNSEALCVSLRQIINTPREELKRATLNNSEIAADNFGIERGVKAYAALYKS